MAQATTTNDENGFDWKSLFSRENLQLVGAFIVIFLIAAVLANQTINSTLRSETAEDVPADVEDIGDEALDPLDDLNEGLADAADAISLDASADEIREALTEAVDEDAYPSIQSIGLYRPDNPAAFGTVQETITEDDGDEETVWVVEALADDAATDALSALDDLSASEAAWLVGEDSVRYVVPLETDDETTAFLWAEVTVATLSDLMAQGAANEDIFMDTANGYTLLVTADNEVIAQFNHAGATPSDISALLDRLTDDVFDEEDEFYEIDTDPLIDEASFATVQDVDFTDWRVIGAFPISEVPNQDYFESTMNLFDASELGDTFSLMVADAFRFLNEDLGGLFRGFKSAIQGVIDAFESVLLSTHWSIVILVTTIIAAFSGGRQVAAIAAFGLFGIGLLGLWDDTMTTMAMLLTSMAVCVIVGIPIGILAARSDRLNEIVRGVLDAMQTIHPFVYLVPIAILFGIGTVPGTIATIIFALPPMVRLTTLGIRQVPEDVVEAARAFGSNDWQLLRDVQIPLAMPSIMAGVNQTLMLSLSMVVIVALIAGGGLGQEIYNAIQNQNIGRAVVSGVVVLLLAVVIDRISQGRASPREVEE
jgi:glycine betaine/proline transport system permease protein